MPSTQELFGDDSSEASAVEETTKATAERADDEEKNDDDKEDEDTPPPRPAPENTITYNDEESWSIPSFSAPSSNQQPFVLKLPNFMGIQTQPFSAEEYDPAQEEEYFGPQSVWNLVRYRYTDDGKRESNTRLVEWEDGSYTLHVGTEAFTVDLMDHAVLQNTKNEGFPGLNGYLYVSHKASMGNNNATTTTLECVHPLKARGTLKPTSLQSAAHKALTVSIRQQMINKRAKIANYQTTQDPEKLKQERIKVKQDLEKAALAKGERRVVSGGARRPRRSRAYLEEEDDDEDYDTTNIKAMKRRTYNDDDDGEDDDFGNDDEDDDDDEEDETFHRVRPKKQVRQESKQDNKKGLSDDDDDDDDGDAEEDDDDVVRPVKTNHKRNAQALFDDDSDSE
ncbi:RNA polymerase-associated protein LEO1 [Fistulifera solaris]|jgi:RNA polymerase-associated protein LEO1|uniref:RNA polymerase-associated protein LEO1 n=1 Tax=Fistulifera solaris TaxID=1519565 RepID=A0A1Z5K9G1_FISSO|nr:RNA polymerase-associated protein LEO1 [Fistulifera solaris]|eukprot:GAX22765.1 RNA polymerase-associated protein LEO1 [Fistulifera solaris]